MPVKNSKKQFKSGGIYHVYNRGVNKDEIFFQEDDYRYFIFLLSRYVSKPKKFENGDRRNYYKKIQILSFCLMNNHFHLLLKQARKKVISNFMRSIIVSYTLYINSKYKRVGHLFQGTYKARLIVNKEDLINISKYIHLNPEECSGDFDFISYPYSSIRSYIEDSSDFPFVNKKEILSIFSGENIAMGMYKDYLLKGSNLGFDPLSHP